MTTLRLLILASLGVALPNGSAAAADNQMIVTLDANVESLPEFVCIVSEQTCKAPGCFSLQALRASMDINDRSISFRRDPAAPVSASPELRDALRALSGRSASGCPMCRPSVAVIEYMVPAGKDPSISPLEGYVTCARNHLGTKSDRVSAAFLRFNKQSTPAAVSAVELDGNQITVSFSDPIARNGYAFLLSLGADYLPNTVGLGTKTRMTLRLNQRCTLSPLLLPAHVAPKPAQAQLMSLDGTPIEQCGDQVSTATAVWLPYQSKETLRTFRVVYPDTTKAGPSSSASGTAFETSWTERDPPRQLKLQNRRLAFSWKKDCLIGRLPVLPTSAAPGVFAIIDRVFLSLHGESSWNESCPSASLPAVGASCRLESSDNGWCNYRCEAPTTVPAFTLPAQVHFDRIGRWGYSGARSAYSWEDTLSYSGQALTSFTSGVDRKIIVEFAPREGWRSQVRNEIDRIEVYPYGGAAQNVAVGQLAPSWAAVPAPSATCSDQFSVGVVGARTYVRRTVALDNGNLVLKNPREFETWMHWAFMAGVGIIHPRNERVYGHERRGEPYLTIGAGAEVYWLHPYVDSIELNVLYEPTYTSYGTVQMSPRDSRLERIPYHRGIAEMIASRWRPNRQFQYGLVAGGGLGGPIFGDTDKVGSLRFFWLFGALFRFKPFQGDVWLDVKGGGRWGEVHEFFGTDRDGKPIADTFHGEPALSERRMLQLFGELRMRSVFR